MRACIVYVCVRVLIIITILCCRGHGGRANDQNRIIYNIYTRAHIHIYIYIYIYGTLAVFY